MLPKRTRSDPRVSLDTRYLASERRRSGPIPDETLQELELDAGDSLYLIEEFVGDTRCLVLSKTPQIADRIDELTEAWDSGQLGNVNEK